ncbi:MAG: hypothetical protein JNK77_02315 [Saprospiraceae bacterium]|nr:hypothetical protein [Saprospiraceae bacterium]
MSANLTHTIANAFHDKKPLTKNELRQNRLLRYARRRKREGAVWELIPENCRVVNLSNEGI